MRAYKAFRTVVPDAIVPHKENTLVNDAGDAMLCDFGLARILEDVPSGLTTTSAPGCTLRYAAPELVAGDGSVHSLASDVWAWGCLLLVVSPGCPYASEALTDTDNAPIDSDRRTTVCRQRA